MELVSRRDGEVAILDLSGKLTLGEGDQQLRAAFEEALAGGRPLVVINLGNVPYIDSAGLGELISTQKRAAAAGGAVRLLNPLKRVYDVLHAVKLDSVFEIYQDESLAIASLRSNPSAGLSE